MTATRESLGWAGAPSLVCYASCQISAFGMEREPMLAALDAHPAARRLRVLMLSPTNAELGLVVAHLDARARPRATLVGGDEHWWVGEPPVISMISNDPILGDVKLIAEAWDAGGLYQVGSFPHFGKWAEWNGRFRDDTRNFIRGFDGYAGLFAECICGSPSLYKETGRKPYHSINFITAHDGFTLRDLVSYNEKHNEANGENNNDGEENNQSWNCGLGPHEDGVNATPVAKVLRDRQMRNFFTALFVSQGTPMVYQGDVYGHTKGGNNNTYCHDNQLNWVDWEAAKDPVKNTGLSRFCRLMRKFKAEQPALRLKEFPNENNIRWHGVEPDQPSWTG